MAKSKNIVFILLTTVLLSACGVTSSEDSTSQVPISKENSEVPLSSEVSSSSEIEGTSESPSTSEAGGTSELPYELEKQYVSATWPSETIPYVFGEMTIDVPHYESTNPFLFSFMEYDLAYFLTIYTEESAIDAKDTYIDELLSSGWIINEEYSSENGLLANDASDKGEIQFYWYDGIFIWYIYQKIKEPTPGDIIYDEIVNLDFSTTEMMVSHKDDEGVWANGPVTMTVLRNGSNEKVGNNNENYLSNPLRLYTWQSIEIALTGSYSLEAITIEINNLKPDYLDAILGSDFDNAEVYVAEQTLTLIPLDKTQSIFIELYGQTRFNSLDVYYSEL